MRRTGSCFTQKEARLLGVCARTFRRYIDRYEDEGLDGLIDKTETYLPAYNAEFTQPSPEPGSAFVACPDLSVLDNTLCERFERTVGKDNCVHFAGRELQIPADRHRCHYVKAKVKVLRYPDNTLAIHHGPRELARYDALYQVVSNAFPVVA